MLWLHMEDGVPDLVRNFSDFASCCFVLSLPSYRYFFTFFLFCWAITSGVIFKGSLAIWN